MEVETQAKLKSQQEPPVCPRTEVKLEERQSPTKPKEWRNKSQTKTRKIMAQTELLLTKVELEGRGSLMKPQGRQW